MKSLGIKNIQIDQLLEEHGEDYILENVAYVEGQLKKGNKIKNIPAYLMKAFKVGFTSDDTKQVDAIEQKRAEEGKEKLELAVLKANFTQERNAKLKSATNKISEKEMVVLRKEFEEQIMQTNFHAGIYKTK